MERLLKKEAARRGYWHRMTRNLKYRVQEMENIICIKESRIEKLKNENKTLTNQINFYTKKSVDLHITSKKNTNPNLPNQETSKVKPSENQIPKQVTSNVKPPENLLPKHPRKKRRRKLKKNMNNLSIYNHQHTIRFFVFYHHFVRYSEEISRAVLGLPRVLRLNFL